MFPLGKICLAHSPLHRAMEFLVKFVIFLLQKTACWKEAKVAVISLSQTLLIMLSSSKRMSYNVNEK